MEITKYIKRVKRTLGYPVTDIELTDKQLEDILEDSLYDIQPHITTSKFMTVPYSKAIDLTDKKISSVLSIMKGNPTSLGGSPNPAITDEAMLFGVAGINQVFMDGASSPMYPGMSANDAMLTTIIQRKYVTSLQGGTELDFTFKEGILYPFMVGTSAKVTIEYIPRYDSAEEITDAYWESELYQMFLANCKITIGRIRSKYVMQSADYELDGKDLVMEGNEERDRLISKWEDSAFHVLQMMD